MKRLLWIALLFCAVPLHAQHIKTVKKGATPTGFQITFTASPSPNVGYNLYRGTVAGGETTTPVNATLYVCTTACQFTTTLNIVKGITYFYNIKAVDLTTGAMSPPSSEVTGVLPIIVTVPTSPSGVTLQIVTIP
jgi:hypothetical protein